MPSNEIPGSRPPAESGHLPDPTQAVGVSTSTQIINVDLSPYEGTVNLRIVVGDLEVHNGGVDANQDITFSKPVTASGTQVVYIYINGQLVDSYRKDF